MKIIIAGDFCPRTRTKTLIENGCFEDCFGDIRPYIQSSDYSLVNLECPVVENITAKPISKCGGNLCCSSKSIDAIKYIGFKAVTLANNHIFDYGEVGIVDTLNFCHSSGLDTVGAGLNLKEASAILYKKIDAYTVAFINCCEHEFSTASAFSSGANPLNPIQQFYSIEKAKKLADFVIVIVHGGHEHFQYPSLRMKETYRFFIDCGADVVINHHQHCFSGYERYKNKLIFYGLGNFFFNKDHFYEGIWNEGYIVELALSKEIDFKIIPYIQCGEKANVKILSKEKQLDFDEKLTYINKIISDDDELTIRLKEWYESTEIMYKLALSPYSNKILLSAAHRGYLPTNVDKKKALTILNFIECESHRDRFLQYLHSTIL